MLGCEPNEYVLYKHFKSRVLMPAKTELSTKTDIICDFEEIKVGRRVEEILFHIKSISVEERDLLDTLSPLPKGQIASLLKVEVIKKYGISLPDELIAKFSKNTLAQLLRDIKTGKYDKTQIQSPIGFFRWQLEELSLIVVDDPESDGIKGNQVSFFDEVKR